MNEHEQPGLMVVAAHPGDFVWRSAGAIALHRAKGWRACIVCASYGVMGEAGALWGEAGATIEAVGAARRREAQAAAGLLGAQLVCLELTDYPLLPTREDTVRLAGVMRAFRPRVILTHPPKDPANADHANTSAMTLQARSFATAPGYGVADMIDPPAVHYFEPHQPEQSDFKADILLDITPHWPLKRQVFEAVASQRGVWDYYERLALQRGAQAGRRSRAPIRHAEAFQRAFPAVLQTFE